MKSQLPSLPFQHHFFHEIRNPTVHKCARPVEIGLPQMCKPMKLPQQATDRQTDDSSDHKNNKKQ